MAASAPEATPPARSSRASAPTSGTDVVVRFSLWSTLPYVERESDKGWELVCKAPCDRAFAPGTKLRVRGRSGPPSGSIVVPPGKSVLLDAQVGSSLVTGIGTGLFTVGVVAGVGTAAIALWPSEIDSTVRVHGAITTGILALAFAGTGVLMWMLGSSEVSIAEPKTKTATRSNTTARHAEGGLRWTGAGLSF